MCVVPGQDRLAVALREADERPLHVEDRGVQPVDRPAQPETKVRGDLVVPRPSGVELAGDRPDARDQRRLDVHVDVLERRVPGDLARLDVARQALETLDERGDLVVGQDPGPAQAADVGDRARAGRRAPAPRRPRSSA